MDESFALLTDPNKVLQSYQKRNASSTFVIIQQALSGRWNMGCFRRVKNHLMLLLFLLSAW